MIHSKYISDILDLLTDTESNRVILRKQMRYIEDKDYEYTGVGLFVTFSHSDEIFHYKLNKDNVVLNGVAIKSTDLNIGASASLFITNGVIDFLEILSADAVYPKKEMHNYTLTQWQNYMGRQLSALS